MMRPTELWCFAPDFWPQFVRADVPRRRAQPVPSKTQLAGTAGIVQLHGVMGRGASPFEAVVDTDSVTDLIETFAADPQITTIIISVDSPGGLSSGVAQLADAVYRAREKKRVVAHIHDMACSAAYWVASQAHEVVASTPSALCGSVGTYVVLHDSGDLQDALGLKTIVVKAGRYKALGADGRITDEVLGEVQRIVDASNAEFITDVRRGRRIVSPIKLEAATNGRVYTAREAKTIGLVDRFASMSELLERASITLDLHRIRNSLRSAAAYETLKVADPVLYRKLRS